MKATTAGRPTIDRNENGAPLTTLGSAAAGNGHPSALILDSVLAMGSWKRRFLSLF